MALRQSDRSAFTLVELLVSISIGLLLIAILVPSLLQARHQGWRITCASNLRGFGRALDYYKVERGHYPWVLNMPTRYATLTSIGEDCVKELVSGRLMDDPQIMYCPVSAVWDRYAEKPLAPWVNSAGQVKRVWQSGAISYIYLSGITYSYPDPSDADRPTYAAGLESPDSKLRARNVLAGDRTVEINPPYQNFALRGSNHRRQGGWFYFTTGDVNWWSWPRLTRHPTTIYTWYWPAMP